MTSFRLKLDLGNAAFEDAQGAEVARILREVAAQLEDATLAPFHIRLADVNGNSVGFAQVTR